MGDGDEINESRSGDDSSYIWILFFALFVLLLVVSIYAFCRGGTCIFWHRYCICRRGHWCCCAMDMEAYRRERESLRRLRELRHIHRMEQFHLRQRQATAQAAAVRLSQQLHHGSDVGSGTPAVEFHHIPLATFSQIPGPIPHSFSSSGRVLTPAELQTLPSGGLSHVAQMNMNSLGFILVPANVAPPFHIHSEGRGEPSDVNALDVRDNLSVEQRRAVLERLLDFTTYHAEESAVQPASNTSAGATGTQHDAVQPESDTSAGATGTQHEPAVVQDPLPQTEDDDKKQTNDNEGPDTNVADQNSAVAATTTNEEPTTFAFPLHEEPEAIDRTCAICLDEFEEGELINDTSKCPHVFHRDCLLSWLDRHTVCPCCRRTMITEDAWRNAASTGTNESGSANRTGNGAT